MLELALNFGFLFVTVVGRGSEIQAEEHLVHVVTIFATYSTSTALQDVLGILGEQDVTGDLKNVGPTPSGLSCATTCRVVRPSCTASVL